MKKLKLAAAILEIVLAIPIAGWMLYIMSWGAFAIAEIALGIIGLCIYKEAKKNTGSILQIIAGALGWIPIAGMILHIVSAVALFKEALNK